MKPFDWIAAGAALLLVASSFAVAARSTEGQNAVARVRGEDTHSLWPLSEDRYFTVAGPLGETHIEVQGGRVRVTASPCREKICVIAGWVSRANEWIACLPNRVFIRVEGGGTASVDAATF